MIVAISSEAGVRKGCYADVVVLPEGISEQSIVSVSEQQAGSLVVGAYTLRCGKDIKCYGTIYQNGIKLMSYHKYGVCRINNTCAGHNSQPVPYLEIGDIAIGVLVCMDIDSEISNEVVSAIENSGMKEKILCIPAMMGLGSGRTVASITNHYSSRSLIIAMSNNSAGEYYGDQVIDSFVRNMEGCIVYQGRDTYKTVTI